MSTLKYDPLAAGIGKKCDGYWWTQTMSDVELHIPVAEGTRGKDLEVVITKHSVKAGLKGQAPILDKKLAFEAHIGGNCDDDSSLWELEDGKDIVISLAKTIRPAADNFQNPIETWVTRCFEDEAPFDMAAPPTVYFTLTEDELYPEYHPRT